MDEQVTWKPHLKLLEMLPMILSWPAFLAACTNACKIPSQTDLGVGLHCSADIQQYKRAEEVPAPTEPL